MSFMLDIFKFQATCDFVQEIITSLQMCVCLSAITRWQHLATCLDSNIPNVGTRGGSIYRKYH